MARIAAFLLWMMVCAPMSAFGQVGGGGVPAELDLINPGARNLALAGIAAGLADDATAILTNPAGLSVMTTPELSLELRLRRTHFDYLSGGRLGAPQTSTLEVSNFRPSFISAVVPAGRVVFGAYRHELVRLDLLLNREGRFQDLFLVSTNRNVDFTNYGGGVGIRLTDNLSVGAGVTLTQFESQSSDIPGGEFPKYVGGYSAGGNGIGFTAGIQVKPASNLALGAAYRRGARINLYDDAQEQRSGRSPFQLLEFSPRVPNTAFKVPDMLSAGISVRPSQSLLIAVDVARISAEGFEEFYYLDDPDSILRVPNATEFHAGVEYVVTPWSMMPTVRFGTWYDPTRSPELVDTLNPLLILGGGIRAVEANYRPTADVWHATGGFGLAPHRRFEINVGGDFSSKGMLLSTSVITRF